MSNHERSGWREVRFTEWHMRLGRDVPCCDLDAVVAADGTVVEGTRVEYDRKKPVAFIDYKHEYSSELSSASIDTQINVADMCGKPFFIVRYGDNFDWFEFLPYNQHAVDKLRSIAKNPDNVQLHRRIRLSERHAVALIYLLRDRQAPDEFLSQFRS